MKRLAVLEPAAWFLLALLIFGLCAGERDLWNPNEPLYGQAVREMQSAGDWIEPTFEGQPFHEKPSFYFILARAAAWLGGGVDESTLRWPAILSGACLLLVLFWALREPFGLPTARWGALILLTSHTWFWQARTLQMDSWLTVGAALSLFASSRYLDGKLDRGPTVLCVGGGLALGLLAKGLVIGPLIALPILVWIVSERRWQALRDPVLWSSAALGLLLAAPWYYAAWIQSDGAYLNELILRQHFTRFQAAWDHAQPWWYFAGKYFWIDMAPWGFFALLALGVQETDPQRQIFRRRMFGWIAVVLLFFSLSASKRSVYILPVLPAVAALAARVATQVGSREFTGIPLRLAWLVQALLAGILLAAGRYAMDGFSSRYPELEAALPGFGFLLVGAGVLCGLGVGLQRLYPAWMFRSLAASLAALFLYAACFALPAANSLKSARAVGLRLQEIPAEARLVGFKMWRYRATYTFYGERPLERIEHAEPLMDCWQGADPCWVLVERGEDAAFRELVGTTEPLWASKIGSNAVRMYRGGAVEVLEE